MPAWCTDLEVTADKVAASVRRGRARWKSEHEPFKRQKNHGDALAHNDGHGPQTLSMVFALRKLLACLAPMSLERGDRWSQRCLATPSRRALWHTRRTAMPMMLGTVWADCLLLSLDEAGPRPYRA